MGNSDLIYEEESQKILDSAYEVQNILGTGFLEKVYENALVICLKEKGLQVTQQDPLKIYFKGNIIGDYVTDIIVNKKIIVEVKALKNLESIHDAQIINYLKATNLELGILINFGKIKLEYKRFANTCKKHL